MLVQAPAKKRARPSKKRKTVTVAAEHNDDGGDDDVKDHVIEDDNYDDAEVAASRQLLETIVPTSRKRKKASKKQSTTDQTKAKKAKLECAVAGCTGKPSYGRSGEQPMFCVSHKEPGSLIFPTARCKHSKSCKRFATWGWIKPETCEEHRVPGFVDLIDKVCGRCKLLDVVGDDGQCAKCNTGLNRRNELAKVKELAKELAKRSWVSLAVGNIFDIVAASNKGVKQMPDYVYSSPTVEGYYLAVFVDLPYLQVESRAENQYHDMDLLAQTVDYKLVFVRFNPESFTTTDSSAHKKFNKSKKSRLEYLIAQLTTLQSLPPPTQISLIRLFHDNFSEKDAKPLPLTSFLKGNGRAAMPLISASGQPSYQYVHAAAKALTTPGNVFAEPPASLAEAEWDAAKAVQLAKQNHTTSPSLAYPELLFSYVRL